MALRMSEQFDRLRKALVNLHPDAAELARDEILSVLVLLTVRARELSHRAGKNDRHPVYERGDMWNALEVESEDTDYVIAEVTKYIEKEILSVMLKLSRARIR